MHVGFATGFAHQRGRDYPDFQFIREELENCVLAEELGYDSVWITEHHFSDYSMSNDPLQLLSYIAGRTKRVKLGTQVIIAPWRDPVRLAEAIINLDIMSGGRALLGFGGGLSPMEFEGLRIDQNQSRALYTEVLDLVIPAIETGVIEGGDIFKQPRRELRPGPMKSFAGRKFCGSLSGTSMRSAAQHGFGNMVLMLPQRGQVPPPDLYTSVWQEVHGPGSLPPQPIVSGNYFVDESADRALEIGSRYLANTMRGAIHNYSLSVKGAFDNIKGYESYDRMYVAPENIDDYVAQFGQSVVAGTPQMVIERMAEIKDIYQPQAFFPHVYFGGMPQDEALRSMRMFAAEVMPEVRSWHAEVSIDDRFLEAAE